MRFPSTFRLRTLMALAIVVSLPIGWLSNQYRQIQIQAAAVGKIESVGGSVKYIRAADSIGWTVSYVDLRGAEVQANDLDCLHQLRPRRVGMLVVDLRDTAISTNTAKRLERSLNKAHVICGISSWSM